MTNDLPCWIRCRLNHACVFQPALDILPVDKMMVNGMSTPKRVGLSFPKKPIRWWLSLTRRLMIPEWMILLFLDPRRIHLMRVDNLDILRSLEYQMRCQR